MLSFRLEINAPDADISYIRYLLTRTLEFRYITRVYLEKTDEKWAEGVEKDALERGEIDL